MRPSFLCRVSDWLIVVAILSVLTCSAAAQSTSGRIVGRVADPSGALIAGVTITLTDQSTGATRTTKTNESGDYTFVEVKPSTYTVTYEQSGFKKNVQKDIIVNVNQVLTLNSTKV